MFLHETGLPTLIKVGTTVRHHNQLDKMLPVFGPSYVPPSAASGVLVLPAARPPEFELVHQWMWSAQRPMSRNVTTLPEFNLNSFSFYLFYSLLSVLHMCFLSFSYYGGAS